MNGWISSVVKTKYASMYVQDQRPYRVKEKLKALKNEMRLWKKGRFGNLEERALKLEKEIASLDIKDECDGLSNKKLAQRAHLQEEHCDIKKV